jgi:excisionase family DNA binding protein
MADLYTVPQAAEALGVDQATINRRLHRGDMRGERIGPRLWLIPSGEVERWREIGKLRPGRKRKRAEEGYGTTPRS